VVGDDQTHGCAPRTPAPVTFCSTLMNGKCGAQ
jgi:hypothetical protein